MQKLRWSQYGGLYVQHVCLISLSHDKKKIFSASMMEIKFFSLRLHGIEYWTRILGVRPAVMSLVLLTINSSAIV